MLQHFFIAGTDCGVGKSFVTCALLRDLCARGIDAAGYKPVACGDRTEARDIREAMGQPAYKLEDINPVYLRTLAEPVMALLGGYSGEKLVLASQLMALLAISVFFDAIVLLTNAVMQAHGHAGIPVINMLASGVVKLAVVYILAGNPALGILGVPMGTALCNLCIAVLNLLSIRRCIPQKPAVFTNLLRPLLPAAIMGAAAWGVWFALGKLGIGSNILLCGLPIAVGGVVYLVCAVIFKSITREDCLLLPKGEKIAKLLHL